MVLLPVVATAAFASSAAVGKWSDRDGIVGARLATLDIDALLQARAAVTHEEVPSAAIVWASERGVDIGTLDSVMGMNFASDLSTTRQVVDAQAILRTNPRLAADRAALVVLRAEVNNRTASFAEVERIFGRITGDIDAMLASRFATLASDARTISSESASLDKDADSLQMAFSAFTAGLDQCTYSEQILTTPSTPGGVAALIGADELFETATKGFPTALGPRASRTWAAMVRNPAIARFNQSVTLAVSTGLRRARPPYASNVAADATVFKDEIAKVNGLTALVLAASADLRAVASALETSATSSLVDELLLLVLVALLVVAAALVMARWVSRPLARIARAAGAVRQGEFEVPLLDETGPREVASAAVAFNEMARTLRAVQSHAVALAERDLDDPVLQTPLPGRTGEALQEALDRLHESVREAERRREELHLQASHDSLTGLLNRSAALDAIERDLARAARQGGSVALLFIDLDGLKTINDLYGHGSGDDALRAVADAINSSTRRTDVRARIGGDEFIVAQLQPPGPEEVSALAERIRRQVGDAELELNGHHLRVSCSIGVAESYPNETAPDELMRRADLALYEAKREGRDRVVWFHPPENRNTGVETRDAWSESGVETRDAWSESGDATRDAWSESGDAWSETRDARPA